MPDGDAAHLSLIEIAIEPKSKADQEKLGVALAKLAAEDPSLRVSTDPESGQTILGGASEEHLDVKIGQLKRYGIAINVGAPQVAFLRSGPIKPNSRFFSAR
jgi:elongation factor G